MSLHPNTLRSFPLTTKLEEYFSRWYSVSAYAAARMLVRLNYGDASMIWKQPEKCPYDIINSDQHKSLLARDIGDFQFVGGPPGQRRFLQGTLLMLLVDRLLYNEAITK